MHIHGVDIISIPRLKQAIDNWGTRFINRIYTDREIEYCRGRLPELAGRFAAKEAVMKALGTGTIGISWHNIEVLPKEDGAPLIHLSGGARIKAEEQGISDLAISLSHSKDYAIASVVGGCNEDSDG